MRALALFAVLALFADASTSYLALSSPSGRYAEASPAVAYLVAALGLVAGLSVSALLRGTAFAVCALAARRFPRIAWPLLALVALGVGYTALLGFGNLLLLVR